MTGTTPTPTAPMRTVSKEMAALLDAHAIKQDFRVILESNGDPDGAAEWLAVFSPNDLPSECKPDPLVELDWAPTFLLEIIAAQAAENAQLRAQTEAVAGLPAAVRVIQVENTALGRSDIYGWAGRIGVGQDYTLAQNVPAALAEQWAGQLRAALAQASASTQGGAESGERDA